MSHPIVWVDLETGGTDEKLHQITQLAAVATEAAPDFKELKIFERKIKLVEGHYTDEALEVQGYDPEIWEKEGVETHIALDDFVKWLSPYRHERISKRTGKPYMVAHMAGHNAEFDGRFLRAASDRTEIWLPLTNWTGGIFDTLHLAKWWFMKNGQYPETFRLEILCETFGIIHDAHNALNDTLATVELARRMMK